MSDGIYCSTCRYHRPDPSIAVGLCIFPQLPGHRVWPAGVSECSFYDPVEPAPWAARTRDTTDDADAQQLADHLLYVMRRHTKAKDEG